MIETNFFKNIYSQLATIWKGFKPFQQLSILVAAGSVFGFLFFIGGMQSSYAPLFQNKTLQESDVTDIKAYLTSADIAYQLEGSTFLVPSENVQQVRLYLASLGLPKKSTTKGFELFDENTWIKGDKELQILEVRALKGQLEQDIAKFENIRSASVILDMPPAKTFGGTSSNTKASVILSLMPNAHLSLSELQAITYHVTGAIRGLTPNMVAISDTTGRLYQPLDPQGTYAFERNAQFFYEESLKDKIGNLLSVILGPKYFHVSVQVALQNSIQQKSTAQNHQSGSNIEGIAVSILIDKNRIEAFGWKGRDLEELRKEVIDQVSTLVGVYQVTPNVMVNFTSFDATMTPIKDQTIPAFASKKKKTVFSSSNIYSSIKITAMITLILAIFGGVLWSLRYYWISTKDFKNEEESQETTLSDRHLETMIDDLKNRVIKDPKPLASMISNLLQTNK